ncbi:hypothetical protein GBA52_010270 [Prunus armeniaca]|nr:hypothetical protein GBA52_010270 [Prunus armeniaca]
MKAEYHRENNHSNHGMSQKTKTKRVKGGGANTRAGAIAIAMVRAMYTFQKIRENSFIEVVDVAQ